jgi:hypothetical protein
MTNGWSKDREHLSQYSLFSSAHCPESIMLKYCNASAANSMASFYPSLTVCR